MLIYILLLVGGLLAIFVFRAVFRSVRLREMREVKNEAGTVSPGDAGTQGPHGPHAKPDETVAYYGSGPQGAKEAPQAGASPRKKELERDASAPYVAPSPPRPRAEHLEVSVPPSAPSPRPPAAPPQSQTSSVPLRGEKVQFTGGYPGAVTAHQWYNVLLYIHLKDRAQDVRNLLEKQSAEIGESMISGAGASRAIERGTTLKLVPELKGFRFNPPVLELEWFEDVQQVRFRLMAESDLAGSSSLGAIDVYAAGLLIAQVPLSIRVRQPGETETEESQVTLARMFEKVFASYSHKDKAVVDACCELSRSMGIFMYVDSASLLSGDDWEKRLREAIRDSDVFQLFWSTDSSASKEVEKEWRVALGLVGEKTERFIRPLYWQQPLPSVPRELSAFHFGQLHLENIERLHRSAQRPAADGAAGISSG